MPWFNHVPTAEQLRQDKERGFGPDGLRVHPVGGPKSHKGKILLAALLVVLALGIFI